MYAPFRRKIHGLRNLLKLTCADPGGKALSPPCSAASGCIPHRVFVCGNRAAWPRRRVARRSALARRAWTNHFRRCRHRPAAQRAAATAAGQQPGRQAHLAATVGADRRGDCCERLARHHPSDILRIVRSHFLLTGCRLMRFRRTVRNLAVVGQAAAGATLATRAAAVTWSTPRGRGCLCVATRTRDCCGDAPEIAAGMHACELR